MVSKPAQYRRQAADTLAARLAEPRRFIQVVAGPRQVGKTTLIEQFVESVSATASVDAEWVAFVAARRAQELEQIVADEGLNAEATRAFIHHAFRDGVVPTSGTAITKILPSVSRFAKGNAHAAKMQTVFAKLTAFFERFLGLS